MGGNIPGGNFLGGNFPGKIFHGGVWWVGIFRVGIFLGGIFLEPFLVVAEKFYQAQTSYFSHVFIIRIEPEPSYKIAHKWRF